MELTISALQGARDWEHRPDYTTDAVLIVPEAMLDAPAPFYCAVLQGAEGCRHCNHSKVYISFNHVLPARTRLNLHNQKQADFTAGKAAAERIFDVPSMRCQTGRFCRAGCRSCRGQLNVFAILF